LAIDTLVSVVIPTYNRAEFIERALCSVLSQSYSDLEVIVVDDASTDDTQKKVRALQQTDHRIHYFAHDINRGAQAARNTGIQEAQGKYIAFLDSDNEWLPQKLNLQMALFSQRDQSFGAIYCGFQKVSQNGEMLREYTPRLRGVIYQQALGEWVADTSTLVVRKDILDKIHGFNVDIRAYQEWDLCIRLAGECKFDFIPECLVLYHEDTSFSISKNFLGCAYAFLNLIEAYHNEIIHECGERTMSKHYLQAGRLFIFADRFDIARSYFLKSIQFFPFNTKAMLLYGASLLGKSCFRFLKSLRQNRFTFQKD